MPQPSPYSGDQQVDKDRLDHLRFDAHLWTQVRMASGKPEATDRDILARVVELFNRHGFQDEEMYVPTRAGLEALEERFDEGR